jgi:hypothetical protein
VTRPPVARRALAVAAVGLLAGCTPTPAGTAPGPAGTVTRTVVRTRSAAPVRVTPAAPGTVAPLPPGRRAPRGERDGRCPYIRTGLDQPGNVGVNLADLEGDRVYRTTEITTDRPPGCRFYFYAPPYEAVADIRLRRLPSPRAARDAMVLTARTGTEPITQRRFAAGLTGILFRTRFFGPDGARDWAFTFAAGRLLVVVHTQRDDTSRNALYIGRAIARRL